MQPDTFTLIVDNGLTIAFIFAVIGISWAIIKLLNRTTDILGEFKYTAEKFNNLIDKIDNDYRYISSTIKSLSETLDKVNRQILGPVKSIGNIFSMVESLFNGIFSNFRNSDPEPDDFLPDEY